MRRETLEAVMAAREGKRAAALVTELKSGAQAIVYEDGKAGELALPAALLGEVRAALLRDRSGRVAEGVFVQCFNPPLRLVLVGAVHIAQALAPMAAFAGFAVTIVDPRGAFATAERFPGVALDTRWPDDALAALRPDRRTAVVTLTHDPKLDDPALIAALRSDCFYIGALGSKKTHATRRARLTEAGFDERQFARIHGPVGLEIGAESPAEIAIAVLAQIVQVRHALAAAAREAAA